MRVLLWRNYPRHRDYELHIFDRVGRRWYWADGIDEDGRLIIKHEERDRVSDDAMPDKPFCYLPEEVVDDLARALGEITQASDATVGHLKDAVAVRDRLLTLVEKKS